MFSVAWDSLGGSESSGELSERRSWVGSSMNGSEEVPKVLLYEIKSSILKV